jgi:hypothetical protein
MTDINEFLSSLNTADAAIRQAAFGALAKFAHHVIGQAQQLAPEGGGIYSPRDPEPGRLRDSAKVEVEADQVLGGFDTEYAAVQHERLDFRHVAPGQAKYLEVPLRANEDRLGQFIVDEVRKVEK